MHRSNIAGLAVVLCSITSATLGTAQANAFDGMESVQVGVGVHGSTLGLGVNAGLDVSETFAARALINALGLDYEETESGNEFTGDLNLQSFGLVADWHPGAGGLRLTGGVFVNNNEVSAVATGNDVDIGGNSYRGRLDVLLDFERLAPYLAVGWTSGRIGAPGLSFSVDAGLLYQRSPRLSGSGTAGDCLFSVSSNGNATVRGCSESFAATLEGDLESEHMDLVDELESFKWYPVLSIGVSYRF